MRISNCFLLILFAGVGSSCDSYARQSLPSLIPGDLELKEVARVERPNGTSAAVYCEEDKSLYLGSDRLSRIDTNTGRVVWETREARDNLIAIAISHKAALTADVVVPGSWDIHIRDARTGDE